MSSFCWLWLDNCTPHAVDSRTARSPVALAMCAVAVVCALLTSVLSTRPAHGALTTESPEVVAAVERGTTYLKTATESRFGGLALIGIALVKTGTDHDHPQLQKAVEGIRKHIADGPHSERDIVYSIGLSLIFLVELDSERYKTEIDWLLHRMLALQKSNGAWGYLDEEVGDTSQMQYAVLSLWTASKAGYEVPKETWKTAMAWMVRTQEPNGGFIYHPEDTGSFVREMKGVPTNSLTSAATGSLFLCQEHFQGSRKRNVDPTVPTALRTTEDAPRRTRIPFDTKRLSRAVHDGDVWTAKNFEVAPDDYTHYYMYAFERHQSFKEAVGNTDSLVVDWYDQMARHLLKTQNERGGWASRCLEPCDTAFSVLFLIRSTRMSLTKAGHFGAGTLVGGRGLPTGEGDLDLRLGRVVTRPRKGPADELLEMMDDPNHPAFLEAVRGFEELAAEADIELLDKHAARLHRLARGTDADARIAAVKALARTRNLDNVPTLIYALSDPDARVATTANDGLRALSRKTHGFGRLGANDSEQRNDIIAQWKQWFLVIRPDAQLDD